MERDQRQRSMALLLENRAESRAIAPVVREQCLELDAGGASTDAYWIAATLGEAALLLESWAEAEDWYGKAAVIGRVRLGDIVSTRRNARLILTHLEADAARGGRVLQRATGRRLCRTPDRSTRTHDAMPLSARARAARARRHSCRRLAALAPAMGYAVRCVRRRHSVSRGASSTRPRRRTSAGYIGDRERFRADSVDLGGDDTREYWSGWNDRYARRPSSARRKIVTASDQRETSIGRHVIWRWLPAGSMARPPSRPTSWRRSWSRSRSCGWAERRRFGRNVVVD